jgi:hypothetical protein
MMSFCFRLGDECHCGVFRNIMAEEPILSHSPNFVMPCDQEGRESCKTMCAALVSVCQHSVPETKMMTDRNSVFFVAILHHRKKEWNFTSVSTIHLYGACRSLPLPFICKSNSRFVCR